MVKFASRAAAVCERALPLPALDAGSNASFDRPSVSVSEPTESPETVTSIELEAPVDVEPKRDGCRRRR